MFQTNTLTIQGLPIVVAYFTQRFDRDLVFEFVDHMAAVEEAYPGHGLLADFTAVEEIDLNFRDLLEIINYVQHNDRRTGRFAMVAGSDFQKLSLANLYARLVEALLPDRDAVFQTREAAIEWLSDAG